MPDERGLAEEVAEALASVCWERFGATSDHITVYGHLAGSGELALLTISRSCPEAEAIGDRGQS